MACNSTALACEGAPKARESCPYFLPGTPEVEHELYSVGQGKTSLWHFCLLTGNEIDLAYIKGTRRWSRIRHCVENLHSRGEHCIAIVGTQSQLLTAHEEIKTMLSEKEMKFFKGYVSDFCKHRCEFKTGALLIRQQYGIEIHAENVEKCQSTASWLKPLERKYNIGKRIKRSLFSNLSDPSTPICTKTLPEDLKKYIGVTIEKLLKTDLCYLEIDKPVHAAASRNHIEVLYSVIRQDLEQFKQTPVLEARFGRVYLEVPEKTQWKFTDLQEKKHYFHTEVFSREFPTRKAERPIKKNEILVKMLVYGNDRCENELCRAVLDVTEEEITIRNIYKGDDRISFNCVYDIVCFGRSHDVRISLFSFPATKPVNVLCVNAVKNLQKSLSSRRRDNGKLEMEEQSEYYAVEYVREKKETLYQWGDFELAVLEIQEYEMENYGASASDRVLFKKSKMEVELRNSEVTKTKLKQFLEKVCEVVELLDNSV